MSSVTSSTASDGDGTSSLMWVWDDVPVYTLQCYFFGRLCST
jgi:hypothetical protein